MPTVLCMRAGEARYRQNKKLVHTTFVLMWILVLRDSGVGKSKVRSARDVNRRALFDTSLRIFFCAEPEHRDQGVPYPRRLLLLQGGGAQPAPAYGHARAGSLRSCARARRACRQRSGSCSRGRARVGLPFRTRPYIGRRRPGRPLDFSIGTTTHHRPAHQRAVRARPLCARAVRLPSQSRMPC